jgi:hypothetical protein
MPSSFERVAAVMGLSGLACVALGAWTRATWLSWLGYSLAAPLILGGIVAAVVGLPLAFLERRRARRQRDARR